MRTSSPEIERHPLDPRDPGVSRAYRAGPPREGLGPGQTAGWPVSLKAASEAPRVCGIHGIVSLRDHRSVDPKLLDRMGELTRHRGPDDDGIFVADGVGIGMRRLSIIDLSGGHQPLSNQAGTVWLVCNGEIYNFRELRTELEPRGHVFKTGSDSEAVIHAYAEWGDDFLTHLEGMFGLALFDRKRSRVILARDRLGIKPLYYHETDGRIVFASEAKALFAVPGIDPEVDPVALHQYLALGYVPAPLSIFRGVNKLPIASAMFIETGESRIKRRIERYWSLPPATETGRTEAEWVDELVSELERSVVSQMVSDVPLGAFLSGGIDSSSIVGLMATHSREPVRTYSIGFDTGSAGSFYNELPYARQVAERFETQHKEIVVRPDVVELMPRLLWHMDEPLGDSAFITTYLVAEFARRDVTVILSGVGGDELFGGYRRYLGEYYGRFYRSIPRPVREKVLAPVARRLPADRHSTLLNLSRLARGFLLAAELPLAERYERYVGVFSDEVLEELMTAPVRTPYNALAAAFGETTSVDDPVRTLFEVDLATQMPDDLLMLTDKMTMATSIECRVPLLDTRLVELSARMPSRHKIRGRELKHILKRALGALLPDEILYRKKRGFGAPMGAWIKNELAGLTETLLSEDSVARRGLFHPHAVRRTLEHHQQSKADHTDHILSLLNLEIWCRLYLDGQAPEALTEEIQREMRA